MINSKQHFKMYKKGKLWLVAGITTSVLVLGTWQTTMAQADTASESTETGTTAVTASTTASKSVALPASTATAQLATSAATQPATSADQKTTSEASQATSATSSATPKSTTSAGSTAPASNSSSEPAASAGTSSTTSNENAATPATSTESASSVAQPVSAATPAKSVAKPQRATRTMATPVAAVATVDNETIDQWMPNKTLQQAVLYNLNASDAGKTWASVADIKQSDLLYLTQFSLQNSRVSSYIDGKSSFSLAGLQYATNLTSLDLLNNLNASEAMRGDIVDITPLAALTKLTYLQLVSQRVSDITPIANLKNLVDLNLNNDCIADFSSLDAAQYTAGFGFTGQFIDNTAVYIPTTGKYTMTNPVKAPKGMTFTLTDSASRAIPVIPYGFPNASVRLFYNGGTNSLTGDQISYQMMHNQIAPGPTTSPYPGYDVSQNPYTYYMISIFNDAAGNEVADMFTPYIVANNAEDVTVNYVDEQGKTLADTETLSGLVGESYAAQAKAITGYQLKTVPTNMTGMFSDTAQTVNFVYQMAYSTVTVHYQNASGKTLKADTTETGQIGTDFNIQAPTLLGYTYQSTQGNASGTYGDTPTEVTFIYNEAYSTITVHYQNASGKMLKADTIETGQIGTDFAIQAPTLLGYTYQSTQGNASGTYGDTPTEVTFIYDEAYSTVTVHYQDMSGKTLKADTIETGQIGTDFAIQAPTLLGYTYQSTQGNARGTYSDTPTEVTFIYNEAQSTVTVHYQDTTGKTLQADDVLTGQIGTDYAVQTPTIKGYTYQDAQGDVTGTYGEQPTEVTLVYATAQNTVTVHYQDTDGKTLQADTILTGQVGSTYTVTTPTIGGYTYQSAQGDITGVYDEHPAEVTLIYAIAKQTNTVTVRYQDATGKTLQADTVLTGKIGTSYAVTAPTITGYTYQTVQGQPSGMYGSQPVIVTFIYQVDPVTPPVTPDHTVTVTARYVTATGQQLAPNQQFTGKTGESYTTTAATIDGYRLVSQPDNANGTFGSTDLTITYIYEPIENPGTGDTVNPGPGTDVDQPEQPAQPEQPTLSEPTAAKIKGVTAQPTKQMAAAKITPTDKVVLTKPTAHAATVQIKTADKQATRLPQMSDQTVSPLWGLTLLGSLLGLAGWRKREH